MGFSFGNDALCNYHEVSDLILLYHWYIAEVLVREMF